MVMLQAAIAGLVALILIPGALFYFDVTPKLIVLLIGAAILCLRGPEPGAAQRTFTWLLLASSASLLLSTILSPNPALSLYGSTWRRYGLAAQLTIFLFAWFVSRVPD